MRNLILIFSLIFIGNVYAEKIITVTLTDEEYKAMTVLTQTPEEWIQQAAKSKSQKMLNELVRKNSDKQPEKITDGEKKFVIDSIDMEKERESRKIKIK